MTRHHRRRRLPAVVALIATLLAAPGLASAAAGARGDAAPRAPARTYRACDEPAPVGTFSCLSRWRKGPGAPGVRVTAAGEFAGYTPADIVSAYRLDARRGRGQTVAIVVAYDNPRAEADLAVYRKRFRLGPCTVANRCLRKVNQRGGTTMPAGDVGWGMEIALDLQAVSAACPRCRLLLVAADSPTGEDLGTAVNTAVRLGADVVSNSYGGLEYNGVLELGRKYYTHRGVPVVVASGDSGFTDASFPASWGSAIAVGGTRLTRSRGGRWREEAWVGAGSGCSAWVPKPTWQRDGYCGMRTIADVAALADPETGLAVYDTYGLGRDGGWIVSGGTSLAAPLIAGMIALAGNADRIHSASFLYRRRVGLLDVVRGSNGKCGGDYLCTATRGYDGPTGLGVPRGLRAL